MLLNFGAICCGAVDKTLMREPDPSHLLLPFLQIFLLYPFFSNETWQRMSSLKKYTSIPILISATATFLPSSLESQLGYQHLLSLFPLHSIHP
jgi:hypothetical protein